MFPSCCLSGFNVCRWHNFDIIRLRGAAVALLALLPDPVTALRQPEGLLGSGIDKADCQDRHLSTDLFKGARGEFSDIKVHNVFFPQSCLFILFYRLKETWTIYGSLFIVLWPVLPLH